VVEAVIAVPAAMVLVLLAVQACLWAHAASIVQAAAMEGDRAACVTSGSLADGVARARAVLEADGSRVVTRSSVDAVLLSGDVVQLHVSGSAESILPGLHLSVSAVQVGVRQEFRVLG